MKDRAYAASLLHTTPQSSPQPHEAEGARLAQQVKSRWTFGICPRFSQGLPQVALVVKNPPANAGDVRDAASLHRSGRSPGGVHGNPLQYSCLENPMHKGAWRAAAHRVAKSWMWLKRLRTHTHVRFSELSFLWVSDLERGLSWNLVCMETHCCELTWGWLGELISAPQDHQTFHII